MKNFKEHFKFNNLVFYEKSKQQGISKKKNLAIIGKTETAGITLIALVISVIVLLILARSKYFCNNRK
ncbi:MAG: hypothetical protein IKF38_06690 [Clostridia bacterium]|nr:hypothetical protein [Clostridia bacterium]